VTPRRPDIDVVARRLRALSDTLEDLRRLEGIDRAGLEADPLLRAAAERLVQIGVDLAIDVNAHLAGAILGRAPTTGRSSFLDAAEAGVLSPELADALAPAAGLRNVLVHRYVDIDIDLVARAVGELLDLLPRYVAEVSDHLSNAGDR
jgi:uncharacterized protein YutE (UPF0331/DUF86 family)